MSMNPRGNGPTSVSGLKTPPPGNRITISNGIAQDPLSPRNKDTSSQTQCRNILIYGYCRYQDRGKLRSPISLDRADSNVGPGCIFNHDSNTSKPSSPSAHNSVLNSDMSSKKKLNVESAAFTPGASPSFSHAVISSPPPTRFSAKALDAAVFTPRGTKIGSATPPISTTPLPQMNIMDGMMGSSRYIQGDPPVFPSITQSFDGLSMEQSNNNIFDYNPAVQPQQVNPYAHQSSGDSYYQQQNYHQPLQYHLYAPLGPHKQNLLPYQKTVHDLFINDGLREELQRKCEAALQVLPNSTLPSIDAYHSLVPLDMHVPKTPAKGAANPPQSLFGYTSWVYKAFSSKDGSAYILRRLEGFRLSNEKAIRVVEQWKRVLNANLVTVHDAFTTRAFGDTSIVFVFDYHPLAQTLQENHFGTNSRFQNRQPNHTQTGITEQLLWSYIIQITSAIKTIHTSGLAARMLDLTKILVTSKNRIRLNCCSILDVLQFDTQRSIQDCQQDDYIAFGKVIMSLACNNPHAFVSAQKSMDYIGRTYTPELKSLLLYLFNGAPNGNARSMDDLLGFTQAHILQNFDSSQHEADSLESVVTRELENARVVRLLCKFGFINERPEFDHDRSWSETGDRYLIMLFRDYIFHQVDDQGLPVLDLVHVLSCLNKLDAGIEEKIMLVSRDEQNCIIVTYRELKRAIESSFQELQKGR